MSRLFPALACASAIAAGCSSRAASPTGPSAAAPLQSSATQPGAQSGTIGEQPPFNLEAILQGDGFGHVEFRQRKDSTANIIDLDVWVRDLLPDTSYRLQRAVDTQLDGVCTGTNWLTLGQGPTPQAIVTDATGAGRADLWRDLSALAPGTAFDIYFRVIQDVTDHVALESGCYRFVVRN